jgi:hypothetical protein
VRDRITILLDYRPLEAIGSTRREKHTDRVRYEGHDSETDFLFPGVERSEPPASLKMANVRLAWGVGVESSASVRRSRLRDS